MNERNILFPYSAQNPILNTQIQLFHIYHIKCTSIDRPTLLLQYIRLVDDAFLFDPIAKTYFYCIKKNGFSHTLVSPGV